MKRTLTLLTLMLAVIILTMMMATTAYAADECPVIVTDVTKDHDTITSPNTADVVVNNLNWLYDGNKATGMLSDPNSDTTTVVFTYAEEITASEFIFVVNSMGLASSNTSDKSQSFDILSKNEYDLKIVLIDKDGKEVYNNSVNTKNKEEITVAVNVSFKEMKLSWNNKKSISCTLWEVTIKAEQGEHPWTLVNTQTEAKCETDGKGEFSCSCGKTKTDIIPKLGHAVESIWQWDEAKDSHYRICSRCQTRQVEGKHYYSYDCDTKCNECAYVRDNVTHSFPYDCTTQCVYCKEPTEPKTAHTLSGPCDVDCNVCSEAIPNPPPHPWSNNCQAQCSACGFEREVPDHEYSAKCDDTCDECGATRKTQHDWRSECDEMCDVCGKTRTASAEHKFANDCDAECNNCKTTREVEGHKYSSSCDKDCDVCGANNPNAQEHQYTNGCDTTCNLCNNTRIPEPHVYKDEAGNENAFVTLPATETAEGERTKLCLICNAPITEVIPMLEKEENIIGTVFIIVGVVTGVSVIGAGIYLIVSKKLAEKKRLLAKIRAQMAEEAANATEEDDGDEDYEEEDSDEPNDE